MTIDVTPYLLWVPLTEGNLIDKTRQSPFFAFYNLVSPFLVTTIILWWTYSIRTQSKAEKRAEHNATERARREGLNTRFQQLAHLLPNLQHDTRPSKGTIIERTLEFGRFIIRLFGINDGVGIGRKGRAWAEMVTDLDLSLFYSKRRHPKRRKISTWNQGSSTYKSPVTEAADSLDDEP
jgi:hypothetical protein